MAFFVNLTRKKVKKRLLLVMIFSVIAIPLTMALLTSSSNLLTPTNYTISTEGNDIQIPEESYVYSEETIGNPTDVFVNGDYVNVADFSSGLEKTQVRQSIDIEDPIITDTPGYLIAELGYSDQFISWTANDSNPDSYTVELQGSGVVAGPTSWISDVAITYNISEGFTLGDYIYIVNFTDNYGNFITDNVKFTVIEDTTRPSIGSYHLSKGVGYGYIGVFLSWRVRDLNPDTYIIELQGSGIVEGPMAWDSVEQIIYNIPDGFDVGVYSYKATFTDDYGNSASCYTSFTVNERARWIPGAGYELLLAMSIGTVASIIIVKKKKKCCSNLE